MRPFSLQPCWRATGELSLPPMRAGRADGESVLRAARSAPAVPQLAASESRWQAWHAEKGRKACSGGRNFSRNFGKRSASWAAAQAGICGKFAERPGKWCVGASAQELQHVGRSDRDGVSAEDFPISTCFAKAFAQCGKKKCGTGKAGKGKNGRQGMTRIHAARRNL